MLQIDKKIKFKKHHDCKNKMKKTKRPDSTNEEKTKEKKEKPIQYRTI